ncbi:histidine phosphatase family protein [Thalassotalea sediminis]|uniref:histidine phosphatase family protein n=1 Tax=Thalassotalea sediminis TaxID=1759089 RepID=UPI0025731F6A|nr:histidine phosphatase family protein [Thalassotalea sediminis]
MANIFLMRHGKVQGEAALYGHTDVGVDEQENKQLAALVGYFFNLQERIPVAVLSSPLRRCSTLADQVSTELSLPKPMLLPTLKEMNFGRYDGVNFDELYQQVDPWCQLERFWQDPVQHPLPDAELLTGFVYRVNQAWQTLLKQLEESQGDLFVVCHGGVIRMILALILNINVRNPNWYTQLSIGYGSLTKIDVLAQQTRVKYISRPLSTVNDRVTKPSSDVDLELG